MEEDRKKKKPFLRRKILLPVTVVVVGIIILFSLAGYFVLESNLDHKVDHELEEVDSLFSRLLASEGRGMQAQLSLIAENRNLINAWKKQDRVLLQQHAEPILDRLKKSFQITHFYFMTTEQVCFLRAHTPDRHGDLIKRHTMRDAVTRRTPISGIELGRYGTFTLRSVRPWIVDGTLIGYLELGEEIGHLTPQLQWVTNLDVIFTIDKVKLNKTHWSTGVKFLGKQGHWDEYDSFVVMDTSLSSLTPQVKHYLSGTKQKPASKEFSIGENVYRMASMPLKDAAGVIVGKIFVLYDITTIVHGFRRALLLSIVIALAAAGLMLIIFHFYIGKVDRELCDYRNNLEELIETRTVELQKAQQKVKALGGCLPICSSCKKIRDDDGDWKMFEIYISQNTDASFDHCICESCLSKQFPNVGKIREGSEKLDEMSDEKAGAQ